MGIDLKINTFFTPLDANPNPPMQTEKEFWKAREHAARAGYLQYLTEKEYGNFKNLRRQSPALLSLCAVLREDGHKVGYFIPDSTEIDAQMTREIGNCNILLMNSMTANFNLAVEYAKRFRATNPRVLIGIGGHHAPYLPENSLIINGQKVFDFTVWGYSENAVTEIARKYKEHGLPESIFNVPQSSFVNSSGNIEQNPGTSFPNLAKIPLPANDLIPTDNLVAARVFTAYGCPFNCEMCNLGQHRSYSERPLQLFEEEIRFLRERKGVKYFYIGDPTLAANIKRFRHIVHILGKFPDIKWGGQTRLPIAQNPDFLEILKDSNCVHLELGIETFSQKLLDRIRKGTKSKTAEQTVYNLAKLKTDLNVETNWMFSVPGADESTIQFDTEKIRQLAQNGISVHLVPFVPFPGTPIYNHPEQFGIRIEAKDYSQYAFRNGVVFSQIGGLSREKLNQLYEVTLKTITGEIRKRLKTTTPEILSEISSEPF